MENKTYTFAEVVQGLRAGKKFRKRAWTDPLLYIYLKPERSGQSFAIYDSYAEEQILTMYDFEGVDWVEVNY